MYEGCGDIKGCFGMPAGCAVTGTCEAMVTYSLKGLRYEFELWAARFQSNSYVAVGFSKDAVMVTFASAFASRSNRLIHLSMRREKTA